jgi:hypothetical protein
MTIVRASGKLMELKSFEPIKRLIALWRVRALRLIVLVSTAVGGTAAFIAGTKSIIEAIRPAEAITLSQDSKWFCGNPDQSMTGHITIRKSGGPSASNCRFQAWSGNSQMQVMHPRASFGLPTGAYEQSVALVLKSSDDGHIRIILSCTNAGSSLDWGTLADGATLGC